MRYHRLTLLFLVAIQIGIGLLFISALSTHAATRTQPFGSCRLTLSKTSYATSEPVTAVVSYTGTGILRSSVSVACGNGKRVTVRKTQCDNELHSCDAVCTYEDSGAYTISGRARFGRAVGHRFGFWSFFYSFLLRGRIVTCESAQVTISSEATPPPPPTATLPIWTCRTTNPTNNPFFVSKITCTNSDPKISPVKFTGVFGDACATNAQRGTKLLQLKMLTANPTELTEGKLYQMVERACPTGTRCASEKTHCELIPANPVHGGSNSTTTPTQDTTAQLEAALKAFLRATKTPRDLNKDGIYEDTNGNGSYDFADCVLLYASLSGGTPGANVLTALDVNKDKKLDKNDSLQCAAAVSGTTTTPECLLAGTCTAGENVPILNPTKIPKILSVALTPKTATQGTLIKLVTKTEGMSTSTIATALIDTAFQVTLYDDGKHDDGKAADGYYATVIDTTKLAIGTHQGAVSIGGLTSPFSFEIIQIFSRCEALKQNGSTDDKLDVLFYGAANFGTVDAFLTEARRIMNRLLAYEPYKSNASKFNFYAYRELVSGGCELVSGNQYFCGVKPIVSETLDQCPGDQHIYLTNNSQPSYAVRGQGWLFMSAPEDNGDNKVVVHEFSHALAALLDEYSLKNNPTSLPPNLNCAPLTSTTACPYPYWCGGIPASQVRLSCAPNTNQTACVQNPLCVWGSMLFSGNVTTLGGEQAQCFINWRLQPDLGMACEAGTGCFQGCVSESGAARSTRLNIMFDQHAGEFGPVNTRIIVKALQQYK